MPYSRDTQEFEFTDTKPGWELSLAPLPPD
jgi:hypothetical protein